MVSLVWINVELIVLIIFGLIFFFRLKLKGSWYIFFIYGFYSVIFKCFIDFMMNLVIMFLKYM